jgi:hypothetical protein
MPEGLPAVARVEGVPAKVTLRGTWAERPRFDLESLGGAPKVLEMAGLSPQGRDLLPLLKANLDSALLAENWLKPGDLPRALVEQLPEPLRVQFKCVRGLRDIGFELGKPGDAPNIQILTGALKDVNAVNPKLAGRVRDAAAAAAERKGQPRLAGQLRNIELVAPAPPADPPIPRGVADLPPPPAPGTGQASQQESVLKGLDDLGPEVHAEAQGAERKLTLDLERWADFRYTLGHGYYQLARLPSNQDRDRDNPQLAVRQRQQQQQCRLLIAGTLGRKLLPSERLLVADMVAQGYTNEQIVAELQAIDEDRP